LRRWVGLSYFQFHTVSCFCPLNTPADSNTVHTFFPIQPYVRLFNFEFNYNYELFSSLPFSILGNTTCFLPIPPLLVLPLLPLFHESKPYHHMSIFFFFHHSTFQTLTLHYYILHLPPFICPTLFFFFLHCL